MKLRNILLIFILLVSFAHAETLIITLKNGKVYKLDTSEIQSLSFSGSDLSDLSSMGNSSKNADFSGIWKYSGGKRIIFKQNGSYVTATYRDDNGVIDGQIKNGVFQGVWIEDHSNQRCKTHMQGRYYWGRVQFKLQNGQLIGHYNYCDSRNLTHPWNLTR